MSDIIKYKTYDFKKISKGILREGLTGLDSLGRAADTYNFAYDNGIIKDAIGITNYTVSINGETKVLRFPDDIKPIMIHSVYFKDDSLSCLVIITDNDKVYIWKFRGNDEFVTLLPISLDTLPCVFGFVKDGAECIGLSQKSNITVYNIADDDVDFVHEVCELTDISFFDGRAIGLVNTDGYKFWYSDSTNPADWRNDSDQMNFQSVDYLWGKCLRIFKMEENLYLIREYGIQRLFYDTELGYYQIHNVGQSIGRIYPSSICQNGANIIYITTSGLYRFNGSTSKLIETNIDFLLEKYNDSPTACQNGNYYIVLNHDFGDSKQIGIESSQNHTNNLLVKLNLETNVETLFRGVDVLQICEINTTFLTDLALVVFNGQNNQLARLNDSGMIFDNPVAKHWKSVPTDFGMPAKKKIISRLFVITKQDITLTCIADNKKYTIDIKGSDSLQAIRPNISGTQFSILIDTTSSQNEIYSIKALVGYALD